MLQEALSTLPVRLPFQLSQCFTVRYDSGGEQTHWVRADATELQEGNPVILHFLQLVPNSTSAWSPEDERGSKYAFFARLLVKSLPYGKCAAVHGRRTNFTRRRQFGSD